jgi:hypothetical protein
MAWLVRLRGRVSTVLDHDLPPTGLSRSVNFGLALLNRQRPR